MSVIPDITLQACSQKVIGNKVIERRVSAVILNVCQSTGIAKGDGSRQSLENHGKLDENQTFSNKKFGEDHDVHHNMALAEDYSQTTRSGGVPVRIRCGGDGLKPFLGSGGRGCLYEF